MAKKSLGIEHIQGGEPIVDHLNRFIDARVIETFKDGEFFFSHFERKKRDYRLIYHIDQDIEIKVEISLVDILKGFVEMDELADGEFGDTAKRLLEIYQKMRK